ncbi:MAG: kelch repeat-containing protein [Candidatus Binatia bacterium]
MKKTNSITRHLFYGILVLLSLTSVTPLVVAPAALAQTNASFTGSLNIPVSDHTATLLPNGKVLVVGGASEKFGFHDTAELYDPATGTWNLTGSLSEFRAEHTATLLPDGKVLVAGGAGYDLPIESAELYDSNTGTWSSTNNLIAARYGHTATLLLNGNVLIAGGAINNDDPPSALVDTELYDPANGTWSGTGSLNTERYRHTATRLPDGKVLVAGGYNSSFLSLNGAEVYDPATGTWSGTGTLNTNRTDHTATLLPNGNVLVAGGYNVSGNRFSPLTNSELYDPVTGTWSATGALSVARSNHTATLLPNGKVLVAGGEIYGVFPSLSLNSAELYDPATGTWSVTANLNFPRRGHTATVLSDRRVLIAGGDNQGTLASAELYTVNTIPAAVDFDGDGISEIGVYRNGEWLIQRSSDGGPIAVGWGGLSQDVQVPADYDGDGKTDIAVYRDGAWFILRSADGGVTATGWGGLTQDKPLPADYDGDGKADLAVYRDGNWFVLRSSDGGPTGVGWGGALADVPVPADYDGDGKADFAVYRDGLWFILRSSDGGQTTASWGGAPQDIPVPADFDGDGKADITVYRSGLWFISKSSGGTNTVRWGGAAVDIPLK